MRELTIQELARVTEMPARTLRYAVQKGALPARRRGLRRLVVSIADAERFVGRPISGNNGKSGNNDDNPVVAPQHAA